ncbi:AAA family ATPase [Psychroflexus planctonicus]|uniref:Novel STAND NTPase 1 domain-containing protein n=1 Tax=Psychroflexus planctonicus TaxID=1526575 RepID=A0ABQ1SL71_9FLAO|nr:AAA family ATPase [Psychroflexus planctonicus]GGE40916.1 hypothetical protein GCM10010832_21240 [Psychroflexus planctonicus]
MPKDNRNPFVGLKPYSESESDLFFGREEEIENLLLILQKNKLLTLTGAPGSGKTSLIVSGLIPRLKRGFIGVSGKEWSVAYMRPGVNPIKNLAHALSENFVLKQNKKSNISDYKYYEDTIEKFGSNSIVEIYKNSEIFNQKNLLIVIDQVEDFYKYKTAFDYLERDEDNMLMDIVYKSVSIKKSSIYFLICIGSNHLTKLNSYTKLQEIITKSQFTIPNLSKSGLIKIFENTFQANGIYIDHKIIDKLHVDLNEEISYLPNLQFLLKKLYDRLIISKSNSDAITSNILDELGGLKYVIALQFDQFYETENKQNLKLLFKSIVNAHLVNTNTLYGTLEDISSYLNISLPELTKFLRELKLETSELFELIEPTISGIEDTKSKTYNGKNILNLKYFKNINWDKLDTWRKEEIENYDKFKSFSIDAIKKKNNEIDFLKTPELETAINWKNQKDINKNWAKKYPFNFNETIEFINKSVKEDERIKEEKLAAIERDKKKEKKKRKIFATFTLISIILATFAIISYQDAKQEKIIATNAQIDAEKAEEDAKKATLEVEKKANELVITNEKVSTLYNEMLTKNKTINNQNAIIKSKLDELEDAREQEIKDQIALTNKSDSLKNSIVIAKNEAAKSKMMKDLIEIKSEFKTLKLALNDAFLENDEDRVKTLVNESLKKQELFNSLKESGVVDKNIIGNENVLQLNQKILSILENKKSYSKTSMLLTKSKGNSVRSFDINNNEIIAFAGDKGTIYFFDIKNNVSIYKPINVANDNIDDRIRYLSFVSDNSLLATTFSGKLLNINPLTKEVNTIYEDKSQKLINLHIDIENNKQYLIFEKEIIVFDNFKIKNRIQKFNDIKTSLVNNSVLYFVSKNEIYRLEKDNNALKLNIDTSSVHEIKQIYISENHLLLGTEYGKVFWYDFNVQNVKTLTPLKLIDNFELHNSRITCIYFDEQTEILYTSSLDSKVFRYDFKLVKDKIQNSATELTGHEKWIWHMSTFIKPNGAKVLITSDEEGNLLTWYTDPSDMKKKIESLYNERMKIFEE